jgi:CubicO group peptidase (beta-lactamase class C family)
MKTQIASLFLLLILAACGGAPLLVTPVPDQAEGTLQSLTGEAIAIPEMEAAIGEAMAKAGVAGLSMAIINDDQVVYRRAFGAKDSETGAPNDEETIFGAASFSKPVFAYLVMLLAQEGVIDLDRPLYEYLQQTLVDYPAYADLRDDARYRQITARTVLSHSTGFPNWRFLTEDGKLRIMFEPGTRFSYSGEGIALLQMMVEQITGRSLQDLAQQKIFTPLGMTRSSYVWQEDFEANHALPHDQFERTRRLNRRATPDAAGSMTTTAGDYAQFVATILDPPENVRSDVDQMLTPQIAITSREMFGPGSWEETEDAEARGQAWGLGWGLFDSEHGRAFFHTGHDIGWQNYTVAFPDRGIGVVLLSNSDNFESVAREIVAAAIGDNVSPFDWLGYVPFDPSVVREAPPTLVAIEVDRAILEDYVGAYELAPGQVIEVILGDDGIVMGGGEQWLPVAAESETRFFAEVDDIRITFVRDASGRVTSLILETQGMELPPARRLD